MRTVILAVIAAALGVGQAAAQEAPSDWSFGLGLGAVHAPDYLGSDDYQVRPMPKLSIAWKDRLLIEDLSVKAALYSEGGIRAGLSAAYGGGRDEDVNDALRGMGGLDDEIRVGVFSSQPLGPADLGIKVTRDMRGDGGLLAGISLGHPMPLGERATLAFSVNATWADGRHMRSYFGVDADQAARSGHPRFEADAGLRDVGGMAALNLRLGESWDLTVNGGWMRLLGDAADSPIVARAGSPDQFLAGAALGYSF